MGNGKKNSFQSDRWLEDVLPFRMAKQPMEVELLGSKLYCYWETGSGWKWHLLAHILPTSFAEAGQYENCPGREDTRPSQVVETKCG